VFTDEELSRMASVKELTPASLKSIKGIGEKRVEKYGHYFFTKNTHEKSE
jgi:superfamily II DNA helicase RecQ